MSDLSLQERLKRMRSTPAISAGPIVDSAPAAPTAARSTPAGAAAQARSDYAQLKGRPERFMASAPAAGSPAPSGAATGVFERMRAIGARAKDAPSPQAGSQEHQALPWDDPNRPAGSAFSVDEWEAVRRESGYARSVVFELHQLGERGLVVLDADVLGPMESMFLDQALLIPQKQSDHPAWHNAQERLEHCCPEFGRRTYRVVHAQAALERHFGLQGAVLRRGTEQELRDGERAAAPRPRG